MAPAAMAILRVRTGRHWAAVASVVLCLAVGCATVPSIPTGPNQAAMKLQGDLAQAIARGDSYFRVPSGTQYVFSNTSLMVEGAQDMVVDGSNATLWFYYGSGVQIRTCHNVSFLGFTVDYDPPNYCQGTVRSVGSSMVDVDFDPHFLMPNCSAFPFSRPGGLKGAKVAFWDPTLLQIRRVGNQFLNHTVPVPTMPLPLPKPPATVSAGAEVTRWQVYLDSKGVKGATSGALVTIFPRGGLTWDTHNSTSIKARDITLLAGGNMGFHEQYGGGNVYERCRIVRRPLSAQAPSGAHLMGTATEPPMRLMAMNADGFHSDSMRVGPRLLDSEISFTGDDHLNIHSRMAVQCRVEDAQTLLLIDVGGVMGMLTPGDGFGLYRVKTLEFLGAGSMASAERVTDKATLADCAQVFHKMQEPPYNQHLVISGLPNVVYRVHFTSPLGPNVTAAVYSLVNVDPFLTEGAVVMNTHFHDGFSRMGLLKASNLDYVNNTVERAAGLHVYSEPVWLEGALGIHNVNIHGNRIVDNAYPKGSPHVDVMAGLKNITCTDNVFVEGGAIARSGDGC